MDDQQRRSRRLGVILDEFYGLPDHLGRRIRVTARPTRCGQTTVDITARAACLTMNGPRCLRSIDRFHPWRRAVTSPVAATATATGTAAMPYFRPRSGLRETSTSTTGRLSLRSCSASVLAVGAPGVGELDHDALIGERSVEVGQVHPSQLTSPHPAQTVPPTCRARIPRRARWRRQGARDRQRGARAPIQQR